MQNYFAAIFVFNNLTLFSVFHLQRHALFLHKLKRYVNVNANAIGGESKPKPKLKL